MYWLCECLTIAEIPLVLQTWLILQGSPPHALGPFFDSEIIVDFAVIQGISVSLD